MTVQVRLYGTLGGGFPGYRHAEGVRIEIPAGATAGDLFRRLELRATGEVFAVVGGRVAAAEQRLQAGASVGLFQAMGGG